MLLPDDVQQLVVDGKLSTRQAREIARASDEPSQRAFVQRAINDELKGSEVEQMVKAYLGKKKRMARTTTNKPKEKVSNSKLTFATEYGTVQFIPDEKVSNHHVAEGLKQALEEVELRIQNGIIN
ncbi:MAG: hypothetical protein KDB27_22920 [Planctomycetales bacterium]|nr:hypothetical protein [Planctomycetales bacterium]